LREAGADTSSAFDGPDPVLVSAGKHRHLPVAHSVVAEPALRQDPFATVDDNQRVTGLMRVDTNDDLRHEPSFVDV
jgi:hypothetical protein